MGDIFTQNNLINLFSNKFIWVLGDSNMRAVYKDLVYLFQRNGIISPHHLKNKLEPSFMGDKLLMKSTLSRGRNYREERQFFCKCLQDSLERRLMEINSENAPDVIIINSSVWDVTRWGPNGIELFKKNLSALLKLFRKQLPPYTLVLWVSTPPVASKIRGAFLIKQLEFMQSSVRYDVMEANLFAREEVVAHGYDLLDLHYYLLMQIDRRTSDGVHWLPEGVRFITNLICTHISLSLNVPLPGNFGGPSLERLTSCGQRSTADEDYQTDVVFNRLDHLATMGPFAVPDAPLINKNKKRRRNRQGNAQNIPPLLNVNNNCSKPYQRRNYYVPY